MSEDALKSRIPRDLGVALTALTRIPVRVPGPWPADAVARAAWAFPLVGVGIGALGALGHGLATLLGWSPVLAAITAIAVMILATGALHEDGLADTADGLGSDRPAQVALAIMRDSRIGTYGALALGLVTAARIVALASISGPASGLIVAAALSRGAVAIVMHQLPPARPDGQSAAAGRPAAAGAATAAVLPAALALALLGPSVSVAVLLAAAGVLWPGMLWLRRRLGGQTGDTLGAAQQAVELAVLLVLVSVAG